MMAARTMSSGRDAMARPARTAVSVMRVPSATYTKVTRLWGSSTSSGPRRPTSSRRQAFEGEDSTLGVDDYLEVGTNGGIRGIGW